MLTPSNRDIERSYNRMMEDYSRYEDDLRKQRGHFLATNPNHPYADIMFMNVCAPPQKIIMHEIK